MCVCVCSGQSGQYWTLGAFSLGGSDDGGLLEVDLSVTSARSGQHTFPDWRCKNTGSLLTFRLDVQRELFFFEGDDVRQVEFMYLVLTVMPGESYGRRLRSLLLCFCDVF